MKELIIKEKIDVIGVHETIKKDFSARKLNDLVGNGDFGWNWIPTNGHSGGVLMGVRTGKR